MSFSIVVIILAIAVGSAYATPFAEGGLPGNSLCDSNNAVLQALRDPRNSADASTFCQSFIQSTTRTTATATATQIISTRTITPEPIVLTKTSITVTTTTKTASGIARRWALEKRLESTSLPPYVSRFRPDHVSSACSCIVTAGTTTVTLTTTRTQDGNTTTTALASTTTTTTTLTITKVACSESTPIVRNAGFEDGDDPWTLGFGELGPLPNTTRTSDSNTGAFGATLDCSTGGSYSAIAQVIRTCPGVVYNVSYFYKFAFRTGSGLAVKYMGGFGQFDNVSSNDSALDTFTQRQQSFIATTTSGNLVFELNCGFQNPEGVGRVTIDDIVITSTGTTLWWSGGKGSGPEPVIWVDIS